MKTRLKIKNRCVRTSELHWYEANGSRRVI